MNDCPKYELTPVELHELTGLLVGELENATNMVEMLLDKERDQKLTEKDYANAHEIQGIRRSLVELVRKQLAGGNKAWQKQQQSG